MRGFIYERGVGSIQISAHTAITDFSNNGLNFTQVAGVSGNGQVVIGFASSGFTSTPSGNEQAFKYSRSGAAFEALGTLSGGNWSIARAVNSDGSVIVGQAGNAAGREEAFVHQNGIMTGLGFLQGGISSNATGVSSDGSVIVGHADAGFGRIHGFVYANQTMLDETEWMRSLNGPGSLTASGYNLTLLALEGAHHRPLMSYDAMGKQTHVWATGDFGASSRQTDRRSSFGEVGASQTYGETVVGVAVGTAKASSPSSSCAASGTPAPPVATSPAPAPTSPVAKPTWTRRPSACATTARPRSSSATSPRRPTLRSP
jgi:probable HAF family extracellular repeat protein